MSEPKPTETDCENCNGTGKVKVEDGDPKCYICKGTGKNKRTEEQ